MAELEKAGIPTAAYVARDFVKDWRHSARVFGVRDLPPVALRRPLVGLKAADIYPYVDAAFDAMVLALTVPMPHDEPDSAAPRPADVIAIDGEDRYQALEHMNRMFLEQGWGDGYPLWAATRECVDAILTGTRRAPEDVVAVLAPGGGLATVEKIAINAAMTGCKPEYLPILIAAVEAISDPHFMLRNVSTSTGAHAPLMLVNGPVVKKLGINSGRCALGPGAQSAVNTTLGRTLRLIYMNLGHAYPGVLDMDTLGSPNKYSMCLGENEDASPWEPYHVEHGFGRDASVVTLHSTYAMCEVNDNTGSTPEQIFDTACAAACNQAVSSVGYWLHGWRSDPTVGVQAKEKPMLLLCPLHAEVCRKHGWSKQNIRDYLFEHARIAFGRIMANKEAPAFRSSHPKLQWLWDSPQTLIPVLESPACLEIVVAGAAGGARSTYSYGAAEPVSRLIEA